MQALLKLSRAIDAANERIGRWSAWGILVAVLICAINAVVRYSLNMSSNAWLEMQWYLNSATFLLVAAWTLKQNAHVRIDVFIGRYPPRAQAWIDLLGGLVMLLPICILIAWFAWPSLVNSIHVGEISSDPGGLTRWPMRLLIVVGFSLLALQGVSEIIKRAAVLRGLIPNPGLHHETGP